MKKIISLFQRNYDGNKLVRNEVVPGAEWVLAGEGVATQKLDGTCCMVRGGKLYKRYEYKPEKDRNPPVGFEPATELDETTGKQQGWMPIGNGPEDKWHREAFGGANFAVGGWLPDGTYELCGPKIQGNPEGSPKHQLYTHGAIKLLDCPRSYNELYNYLAAKNIEGIVWWHPDGRMVKIKAKDFGIKRRR